MPSRHLFGPVNPTFAKQCLAVPRREGLCVGFSGDGTGDLTIARGGTWGQVTARFARVADVVHTLDASPFGQVILAKVSPVETGKLAIEEA